MKHERKIIGNLTITKENAIKYANVTEVSGSVDVRENAMKRGPRDG